MKNALEVVREAAEGWRTGGNVEINLYQHDRPVAMCQTRRDARTIAALARLVLAMLNDEQVLSIPHIHGRLAECAREIEATK